MEKNLIIEICKILFRKIGFGRNNGIKENFKMVEVKISINCK